MELIRILSLAVILCSCSWRITAQSDSSTTTTCQVQYIEQPPDQLQCNPYINAELRLECIVVAQSDQTPTLVWYRRHLVQTQQSEQWVAERLNPSQNILIYHQARTSSTSKAARSRLILRNIGGSNSGEYYCVAQINGIELSVPSDAVFLRQPSFYSNLGLAACARTGALLKQERKCADWSIVTTASSSVPVDNIGSRPTATPTAKEAATSSSSVAKPPTVTVSKPTSSEAGSDGSTGGGATTSGMVNPIDKITATTVDPTQTGNRDNSGSVPAEEELIREGTTNEDNSDTKKDPNVLLELYIAIAILVIFGVIIMILMPITVWMCLKKRGSRKVDSIRRSRQNLEFVSAHCELPSPSVTSPVASDYLVPQPSWRSHKQQVQPSDCQKPTSLQQSYEITLSYSHEYEDVRDVIEDSTAQIDTGVNESPTMETLVTDSPPVSIGIVYANDGPVRMKRNAAYRMYRMVNSNENSRRNGYCNEVTVSNPLNCLYAAQHSTTEQQSNLE